MSVERGPRRSTGPAPARQAPPDEGDRDAVHGDRQGDRGQREGRHAQPGEARGDGRATTRSWSRPACMLDGDGLQPSSKGARVTFAGGKRDRHRRTVHRDQGADRRLLDARGEVARGGVEWIKRCRRSDGGAEVEIRQIFDAEDFGEEFTPELREARGAAARRRPRSSGAHDPAAAGRGRRRPPTRTARSRPSGASSRPGSSPGLTRIVARRRAGRGAGPGRAGRRARAVAGDGRPGQPGRLADDHRQAPGDRPVPPRRDAASASTQSSAASSRRAEEPADLDRGARRRHRRRPAAAGLHRLPPGAVRARRGSR